jgi:hypothetical protein
MCTVFFFFQKKKQKAFVLLSQKTGFPAYNSANPTRGVGGLPSIIAPSELSLAGGQPPAPPLLCEASTNSTKCPPIFGEADPGGLGAQFWPWVN